MVLSNIKITKEEEEEIIRKAADIIFERNMGLAAIYILEMIRPLAYIGGQMGTIFISPYLLLFGESFSENAELLIKVFQKKENIEKVQLILEKKIQDEKTLKEKQPEKKTGWKKILPF